MAYGEWTIMSMIMRRENSEGIAVAEVRNHGVVIMDVVDEVWRLDLF